MKKQHLSLITLALVASIMMGCKASSTKAQAANDIKEAQAADTLVVNTDSCILQEGKIVQCTISVDYPTEPNELSKNIRAILNEELANLYLGNINGDEIEKQVVQYLHQTRSVCDAGDLFHVLSLYGYRWMIEVVCFANDFADHIRKIDRFVGEVHLIGTYL